MYFDRTPYALQTPGEPYSFTKTGETYRFEVHSGDKGREGDATQERSEIASKEKLDFDHTYTMTYDFMVEPGAKNTVGVNVGQFHGTPDAGDYGSLGPVFAIRLVGERMRIVTRTDSDRTTEARPADNFIYTDTKDIERGHWYQMKVEIRFDPDGQGVINIWRDGDQLAHYEGGVGYNDAVGPYWKMGIYRPPADETLAVDYRNFDLVDGGDAATSPEPPPPPPVSKPDADTDPLVLRAGDKGASLAGAAGDDRLIGGDGADSLNGAAGSDQLSAGSGADVLNGGDGADVLVGGNGADELRGGEGADLLKGAKDNDTLVGGGGADTLNGGAGIDVFRFEALDKSVDTIADFSKSDKIDLSALGVKSDATFVNGMGAADSHAAIHYDDGALYLDLNGGSAADAVKIAVLSNHASLDHGSFIFA
jgi:hypothetical protein